MPSRQNPGYPVATATDTDAPALASLRNSVAEALTRRFGKGHWSIESTERSALRDIATSRVLVIRSGASIVASLLLATKKPWAIDPKYFQSVPRALYLRNMAVAPDLQGRGIGRHLLEEAKKIAREWPCDAIRLDAYDAEVGAGEFYTKCGFREVGRVTYRHTPLIYYQLLI